MKIKRKGLLISVVFLVLLVIAARLTGIYQLYNLPTGSMEPTLQAGKKILVTNLKGPKRNQVIMFSRTVNELFENDPSGKTSNFCSRLIAMGGDTLQIKNGYAFVNGRLADDTTQLKFAYMLPGKDLNNLLTALEIHNEKDKYNDFVPMGDSAYASLSCGQYDRVKNVIQLTRKNNYMNGGEKSYPGKGWTVDNFGPYIIPADHFFVMGDNRHNAMDSRFVGPIPAKSYKGALLMKF